MIIAGGGSRPPMGSVPGASLEVALSAAAAARELLHAITSFTFLFIPFVFL